MVVVVVGREFMLRDSTDCVPRHHNNYHHYRSSVMLLRPQPVKIIVVLHVEVISHAHSLSTTRRAQQNITTLALVQ